MLDVQLSWSGYGTVKVLRDVQMRVGEGELVAVLGANGAGKTTLLRTISGILVRSDARVYYCGRDISRLSAHGRARCGIVHVPEGRQVFVGLTVEENLQVAAIAAGTPKSSLTESFSMVHELFPVLAARSRQQATALSGGEQQMLAIGRGLMASPQLLMVDEASLGLSPELTLQVFDALTRIRTQGISVVLVEQNALGALAIADRAYILERGRVALDGLASTISKGDKLTDLYLGGHSSQLHSTQEVQSKREVLTDQ